MAPTKWDCIPMGPFLTILYYLDNFKDVVRCSQVCRRYNKMCCDELLWKKLCFEYWHLDTCLPGHTWKTLFCDQYLKFGRYKNYKKMKMAWQKLQQYLQKNCEELANTIQEGATEQLLDVVESKLGHKIPEDIRCCYRIANGQNLNDSPCWPWAGLFGSVYHLHGSYQIEEYMLDCEIFHNPACIPQLQNAPALPGEHGANPSVIERK